MNKLVLKQGEAKTLTFTVKDALGAIVDISAASLTFGVKKAKSDVAYTFSKLDGDFNKTQAAQGVVTADLTSTDTNQPEGTYVAELKCALAGGAIRKSQDFFLQIKQAVTA